MPHRKLHEIVADQRLVCVAPSDKVSDVAASMVGNHVGSALVLDGKEVKGIFTGSNLLERVIQPGLDPKKTLVADVMTPDPVSLHAQAHGIECVSFDARRKHSPCGRAQSTGWRLRDRLSPRLPRMKKLGEYDKELEFEHEIWGTAVTRSADNWKRDPKHECHTKFPGPRPIAVGVCTRAFSQRAIKP